MLERFFDEAGGMQLVIHAPFGSRINRAWGLALRKRFCRKFNFELQAAATEDNIVLSLTTAHSFELADVARYLHSASVRPLLIQAMLDAPMFTTRWRWVAGVALALPRFRGGKKVPPQFLRMQAEDLIAAVFPDQIACAENLVGEREVPDHPLTNQAIADCLHEAMDIEGLERLLARLEAGDIRVVACDLTQPSPLALEVLSARPYAYLDDAPLEERRTQAVMARRWHDPQSASDLGRLDPEAIARVRAEAWPEPTNAEELHDALLWLGCLTEDETRTMPAWSDWLAALAGEKRVARLKTAQPTLWIPAERLNQFRALWPKAGAPTGDRAAGRSNRTAVLAGDGAGRNPARAAGRSGAGHRDRADGPAWARAGGGGRRAGGAGSRRRDPARTLHSGRQRRTMVRPAAAGPHPSVHDPASALGDRPCRRARLPALPVCLAACGGRDPPRGTGGAPARAGSARRVRGARARVGDRDPAGSPAKIMGRPGSTRSASRAASVWARLTPPAGSGDRSGPVSAVRATPIALLERRHAPLWMSLAPPNGSVRPKPARSSRP